MIASRDSNIVTTKLKSIFSNPIFWGVFTFFCINLLLRNAFDLSARCNDGWHSLSIGKRGACSWHGGVDRSRISIAFFFSMGAAIGAGVLIAKLKARAGSLLNSQSANLLPPHYQPAALPHRPTNFAPISNDSAQVIRYTDNRRFSWFDLKSPRLSVNLECLECRENTPLSLSELDLHPPQMVPFGTGVLRCSKCSSFLTHAVVTIAAIPPGHTR